MKFFVAILFVIVAYAAAAPQGGQPADIVKQGTDMAGSAVNQAAGMASGALNTGMGSLTSLMDPSQFLGLFNPFINAAQAGMQAIPKAGQQLMGMATSFIPQMNNGR